MEAVLLESDDRVEQFLGRRAEVAQVKELLSKARLVTLTGVAGVGKTRLARHVAPQLGDAFPDGVYLVELAPLRDPSLVVHTIAMALAVPIRSPQGPIADLINFARDKKLLLVVDKCEHVVDSCASVLSELLRGLPDLQILTTSRQPLGVAGEHIWSVPPLETSAEGLPAAPEIDFPAVALFAQRARSVVPDFTINGDNCEIVAEICQQVDGIPLGIELAAARLATQSLEQLLVGLDRRDRILDTSAGAHEPEQHESLRSAIDWSYQLCSPSEQRMWQRLSVFPGGFDLDAVEEVCGWDDLGMDELFGLVDKSVLVHTEHFGQYRYRLLAVLGQYGQEKLRESGEQEAVRRRHRDWCLRTSQRWATEWFGPEQVDLLVETRSRHDDLRAALEFSLTTADDAATGLEMATNLIFYWRTTGLLCEGRYWLDRFLHACDEPGEHRAKALWAGGWISALQGDIDAADRLMRSTGEAAGMLDEVTAVTMTQHLTGLNALQHDDVAQAIAALEQGRQRVDAQLATHPHKAELAAVYAVCLDTLSLALSFDGRYDDAAAVSEQARRLSDEHGELWSRSYALFTLALAEWRTGQWRKSVDHARDALRIKHSFHDVVGMAFSVDLLAWVATDEGAYERGAVLLGAAGHLWRRFGRPHLGSKTWSSPYRASETRCREALGDRAFETARRRGAELTTAQTLAYALAD